MTQFDFLRLPREVRDQIYSYALLVPAQVTTAPRQSATPTHIKYKPLAPNICRLNKQTHEEGCEILYGRNVFHFSSPGELLSFEEKTGEKNRDLVQSVDILVMFLTRDSFLDADSVARKDLKPVVSHWVKALNMSRLRGLREMTLEGKTTTGYMTPYLWALMVVSDDLRNVIVKLLERKIYGMDNKGQPKLILKGFKEDEEKKFPRAWLITTLEGDHKMSD